MVIATTLVVVSGPAEMVFAVARLARDPPDLAWHAAAADETREVIAPNTGGNDEPGSRGH